MGQLRSATGALVEAREQAVAEFRATPAYAAAARDVATTFDAYTERRNAMVMALQLHDPRYATWTKQAADADAEIARAGQNPATTADQFDVLLVQRAEFLKQLQASEDDAVNRDPEAKRLRQQWVDACHRLDAVAAGQSAAVDRSPAVRTAVAVVDAARATVDRARVALPAASAAAAADADPTAEEFTRRYPRHGLGWADAPVDGRR